MRTGCPRSLCSAGFQPALGAADFQSAEPGQRPASLNASEALALHNAGEDACGPNRTAHIAIDNITTVDILIFMAKKELDVEALLPLSAATFYILTTLGDGERHGYAIIQDVESRTDGEVRLSAGTLYRSIQRMQEQGLIEETRRRPAPEDDDERRRYYRITSFGSLVVSAEMRRLAQLIKLARAKGFSPERV